MTDEQILTVRDIPVRNVMSETVREVPAGATATEAARQLFDSGVGSLLVGADPAPPDGIVTETDIAKYLPVHELHPGE
jgi:predicted transcriptional regulator